MDSRNSLGLVQEPIIMFLWLDIDLQFYIVVE